MVTGGNDGDTLTKSVEYVYPDGRILPGKDLPLYRRGHCMISLDSNRVMIIGGAQYTGWGKSLGTILGGSRRLDIDF